jgi:PHD/YefM family antitoxin component YafN of YafNO toxin-antitoxin module
LLNGPSSSGKSTLANALQVQIAEEKKKVFAVISIDDFLRMSTSETIYEDDVFEISSNMCSKVLEVLEKTDGVTYSTNDIDYNIDIETFTEMEFELPIKITNCPQNLQAKILPYKAKIKLNVNRSNYRFIKPERITLYIDYKDINTNISDKFKIYTSQLPKGVKVMTLAPAYADVVFEKLFNLDTTKNVDKTIKE